MKSPAFAKSDPLKIAFRHGDPISFYALVDNIPKGHPVMVTLKDNSDLMIAVRASSLATEAVKWYSALANPDGRSRRAAADADSGVAAAAAAAAASSADAGNLDDARKQRETLNKRAAGKSGGSDAKRRKG